MDNFVARTPHRLTGQPRSESVWGPSNRAAEGGEALELDDAVGEADKIRAKVGAHAQYVISQLAEAAVQRQLFATILEWIGRLRLACASG